MDAPVSEARWRAYSGTQHCCPNWNRGQITNDELLNKLKVESQKNPQPEVHIRGDQSTRYESIGKVIMTAQRAGIAKVSFITTPQATDN